MGRWLDASALSRRYETALQQAGLRPLRFRDLRHTFGRRAISKADVRRVQEWMGHADLATTTRYLHCVEHPGEADLTSAAFVIDGSRDGRWRTAFGWSMPSPGGLTLVTNLLTVEQVAERLGVTKDWVWAQARAGRIPHIQLGRYRRSGEEALEEWLAEHERRGRRDRADAKRG